MPPAALRFARGDGAWPSHFDTPLTVTPRPVVRERRPIVFLAAIVVVVVVGVSMAVWLLRPSPDTSDSPSAEPTTSATPASPSADPEDRARLLRLLPPGYPAGSCKPVDPPKDALAKASCVKNADPDGPPSATYTLLPDTATLRSTFEAIVAATTVVNCPGNIQSPGPWRRNATPQQISGTLVCGFQRKVPTVAWTDDDKLVVGSVQGDPRGPNLDQLYAWWSSHS